MNFLPANQLNLYGLNKDFDELIKLYKNKKLPNKFMLSGRKGIGKCTLAYHLVNFILSENENLSYNLNNYSINKDNKSFKLVHNGVHPNFYLIDVISEKKTIDIFQIRNLISDLNKSNLNLKPRIILIDNIEFFNINSVNALLKILEEPPENTYFILVNNNKKILPTIKSRCLNFNIILNNKNSVKISNNLFGSKILTLINNNLLDYYFTPGKVYNLLNFLDNNKIDFENLSLKKILDLLIDKFYYKKDISAKILTYEFIELFLTHEFYYKKNDIYNYFLKKIDNTKRFNLDEESLFIEFKTKVLNG